MDVRRLIYTQEIFIKQRILEDELKELNKDKMENINNCDHEKYIPIILTKSANPSARCLGCGVKLGSFNHNDAIDASNYKEEEYKEGFTDNQKTGRLQELRQYAIDLLKQNPYMEQEELKEELEKEVNKVKVNKID